MRWTEHQHDKALAEADRRLKREYAMAKAPRNPNAMVSTAMAWMLRLRRASNQTKAAM
ncbi:MAG: hypothetical protein ACJAVI_005310 [Candidatus Azotimanducaceae bacterium]|jgi:hypothetical protein